MITPSGRGRFLFDFGASAVAAGDERYPGWLPREVAEFYSFPIDELTGRGESIGIISFGGKIDMAELRLDFASMQLPMPEVSVVDVDADRITPQQDALPTPETHLDIEVVGAICPDARITVYRAPQAAGSFTDAITAAGADGNSVVSISWAWSRPASGEENALERVVASGVTVCAACGDGGSSCKRVNHQAVPASDWFARVLYPASSPYVLACGGTELFEPADPAAAAPGPMEEHVWNNSALGGGATGGGVSQRFRLPPWQIAAGIDIPHANTGRRARVIPDVSALAAYIKGADWKIFEGGKGKPIGGTSAVAPLWAAFITLVNERRVSLGKSRLGHVNERLYALAANAAEPLLNDVVIGDNRPATDDPRGPYPGYEATVGFDACTGWGTPTANLFHALVGLP